MGEEKEVFYFVFFFKRSILKGVNKLKDGSCLRALVSKDDLEMELTMLSPKEMKKLKPGMISLHLGGTWSEIYFLQTLRAPWTARRFSHSILKEISLAYSLEGLMLKLKLQYFGHLMQRTDSFKKTLMLAKTEGGKRRG